MNILRVVKHIFGLLFAAGAGGLLVKLIFDLVQYRFFTVKGWTPYVWLWTEGYGNLVLYVVPILILSLLSWRMFNEDRARNR